MKLERAQELYTDYLDGTLSPAMKLALEQHFESDTAARADYDDFVKVAGLLARPVAEVDPPLAFRARVMERVAIEYGRRQQPPTFWHTLTQFWLPQQRRPLAGALAGVLALAAIVSAVLLRPQGGGTGVAGIGPSFITPAAYESTVRGVELQPGDGYVYHLIDVHLPASVARASVEGWVLTSDEQITDPNARAQDTAVLPPDQTLTNDEEAKIPIAYTRAVAAGSTLDVMLQWRPTASTDPTQHAGAEVVFTPVDANDGMTPDQASTVVQSDASFYGQLRSIASGYHVTVIVDVSTAPTQPATAWTPDETAEQALDTVAGSEGYTVAPASSDPSGKSFVLHPKTD
jgi:hypothetical protein